MTNKNNFRRLFFGGVNLLAAFTLATSMALVDGGEAFAQGRCQSGTQGAKRCQRVVKAVAAKAKRAKKGSKKAVKRTVVKKDLNLSQLNSLLTDLLNSINGLSGLDLNKIGGATSPTPNLTPQDSDPLASRITPVKPEVNEFLARTNLVFSNNNIRGVYNQPGMEGYTLFNMPILKSGSRGWQRLLNDFRAYMTLDARLIRGSRGESYINEFVWKSYQDGTLLVIHAPEMNDGPVEGRNKLEVLLSYKDPFGGDFANPYRVVRLPLERLQEPDYGVIDAFSPWGPRKLYRDPVTGLNYFGRDLKGLSGLQIGRLEFPEGGSFNGNSQIIFKPAFIGHGQGSSEELVLSGSGMVFKREGVGNLQAASIQVTNPYGGVGPLRADTSYGNPGLVDEVVHVLRTQTLGTESNLNASLVESMLDRSAIKADFSGAYSIVDSLTVVNISSY